MAEPGSGFGVASGSGSGSSLSGWVVVAVSAAPEVPAVGAVVAVGAVLTCAGDGMGWDGMDMA